MTLLALDLADGSWIFLAFLLVFLAGLAYHLYGRRGTGISQRPHRRTTSAPGASGPSDMGGSDESDETSFRSRQGTR